MKRDTIKKHSHFYTPRDDLAFVCHGFILKIKPKVKEDARYGMIISKKTLKLSVMRNRAKRLMRVWIAANEHRMNPELDYIFILRARILEIDLKKGIYLVKKAINFFN